VVEFRAPDAARRWELWALHLPPEHAVDDATLSEVATRCALTGGQIRNAVLHAWLLAGAESTEPDGGAHRVARPITSADLEAAVRREYRKLGTVCPLRADRTAG